MPKSNHQACCPQKSALADPSLAARKAAITGSGLPAAGAGVPFVAPSQVIKESRERQEEGIVIRWERERKQEVMLELRPERG